MEAALLFGEFSKAIGELLSEAIANAGDEAALAQFQLARDKLSDKLKKFQEELVARKEKDKAAAKADLVSRGLGNSTIVTSTEQAIENQAASEDRWATIEYSRAIQEIAILERKTKEEKRAARARKWVVWSAMGVALFTFVFNSMTAYRAAEAQRAAKNSERSAGDSAADASGAVKWAQQMAAAFHQSNVPVVASQGCFTNEIRVAWRRVPDDEKSAYYFVEFNDLAGKKVFSRSTAVSPGHDHIDITEAAVQGKDGGENPNADPNFHFEPGRTYMIHVGLQHDRNKKGDNDTVGDAPGSTAAPNKS